MAVFRDNPYADFNFLVNLGDSDPASVKAGFTEISGLSMSVSVIEYRNGNDKLNTPRLIPGLAKAPEVCLSRGIIGSTDLFAWLQSVANGQPVFRDVTIQLQSEDHTSIVQSWKLTRAIPIRYNGPALSATTSAVAIEELVLACEWMEME